MGRPKKNQALGGAPEVALSDPPGESGRKKRSFSDLLKFAREYENKTAMALYLYRLWPVIDLNLVGKKFSYIDKFAGPDECDLDAIMRKWGRGKYKICLTDSNRKGFDQRLCEATFEVDNPDFEPASEFGWRELDLGSPQNASFVQSLRLRGLLPKEGEETMQGSDTAAVSALTQLVREVISRESNKGADPYSVGLQIAKEIAAKPQQDPMEAALRMVELMNKSKQDNGVVEALKAEIAELRRAASGDSLFDQFKKFRELERAIGGRGGGGGGGMPEWLGELLKSLAPALLTLLMRGGGAPGMAPAPAGPGPSPGAPPAFPPVIPMAPDGAGEGDLMIRLIQTANKALKAFQRGMTGDDFAHSLVTLEDDGEEIYSTFSGMGVDGLISTLKTTPQWAGLAAREGEVRDFLAAFVAYGEPEAPAAEAQAAAPPAAGLVVEVPKS